MKIFSSILKLLHVEYFIWFLVGVIVAGRFIVNLVSRNLSFYEGFEFYYFDILLGIIIALFPFVYYLVFGKYPLQSIRSKDNKPNILVQGDGNIVHVPDHNPDNADNADKVTDYKKIDGGVGVLTQLVINAEDLSSKIYKRSGVYLIFGVLIAFSGILYFSFQSVAIPESKDFGEKILSILPRFGILFFIEFIAFFFLRQYRSAMNEFRHFDEIKRNRESQLALYVIAERDFKEKDFSKVIDKMDFFGKVGLLSKGQTTEFIEASKLNENELKDIAEKVLEITKVIRAKPKKSTTKKKA